MKRKSMPAGRHLLQIPGPSNGPHRILRAMDHPTMDHRRPLLAEVGKTALSGMKWVIETDSRLVIYPSSGAGALRAALVNTQSLGDTVLMYETGYIATRRKRLARRVGLEPTFIKNNWRSGAASEAIVPQLRSDNAHTIKGGCVVHTETSKGAVTDVLAVRRAIDAAGHPSQLMVDTISGLASILCAHDAWGVDVTIPGSQKGMKLPRGPSFKAVGAKALHTSLTASLQKSHWAWTK